MENHKLQEVPEKANSVRCIALTIAAAIVILLGAKDKLLQQDELHTGLRHQSHQVDPQLLKLLEMPEKK